MKLKLFTEQVRKEWIETGFRTVKITGANHLSINDFAGEQFALIEPIIDHADPIPDGDLVESISSPLVDGFITRKNGKYYN